MRSSLLPRTALMVLLLGMVVVVASARAGETDGSPLYGPDEKVHGKTRAEWTVAFLQWGFGIKKDRNPILDGSGEFAAEGQAGPVWFLAGNFGGVTQRKVTVPAGKPIFMPVVYAFHFQPADVGDSKEVAANARKTSDKIIDLKVTVDGQNVGDLAKYRVSSGAFLFNGQDNPKEAIHPRMAGKRLAAGDGYWIMLKPLAVGEHTVRWKGKIKGDNEEEERFRLDITYDLTIVEAGKP